MRFIRRWRSRTNAVLAAVQEQVANRLLENIGMRRLVRVAKNRTVYRHRSGRCGRLVGRIEKVLEALDCPMVILLYRTWSSPQPGRA
ncbi:hypothetical protein AC230_02745 [Streptomyces caatingaensis]|uniref:Uncharacterized protein n=1 Tax=Streptomyces caatingaensis TaxID=1678637 RepID=A0A0K9XJQ0_9ACTN|nr:hypothetical protein AC230_02745 [Streptomyces caatingaensis]